MNTAERRILAIAALLLALAAGLGALGSHSLENTLSPQRLRSFESAVTYHFYHAIGLALVAIAAAPLGRPALLKWVTGLFGLGLICFSGSIYALTFGAPTGVVMAAPVGGVSFMLGWVLFAVAAWRSGH